MNDQVLTSPLALMTALDALGDRPLSPAEAKPWLGPTSTQAHARVAGTGPAYIKLGNRIRYLPADIKAYLLARRRTSTRDNATQNVAAV